MARNFKLGMLVGYDIALLPVLFGQGWKWRGGADPQKFNMKLGMFVD